jgi:hypothetical protein
VWADGCSIAKEVATSAAKMAITDPNFITRSQQLVVTLASKKTAGQANEGCSRIPVFADPYRDF